MGPSRSSGRTPPRAPTAGLSHLYRALPAYFGGKRRLTPLLFSALDDVLPRRSWANRRLLDPFLGGGAVALTAKAHGFEVHANDLARRSFVVGKALIENSESQLAASDVAALFTAISDPAVHASARRLLSAQQASFVAGAIPAIRAAPEPQCWLLELALIKWVLRCFPMSIPAATDARYAADLELDRISDRRVTHYLRARRSARPSVLSAHRAGRQRRGPSGHRVGLAARRHRLLVRSARRRRLPRSLVPRNQLVRTRVRVHRRVAGG